MPTTKIFTRKVITWALYDWANSAFALSVLAVLFPLVLGSYWGVGDGSVSATVRLGWITFAASLLVFVSAPILGAIADAGGKKKHFLFFFAVVGALATAGLGIVDEGNWPLALGLYLFASVGFYSSIVFYDALLVDVTDTRNYSIVSTLGFSIGYLGGATLLGLHLWMLKAPQTFGLESVSAAFRFSFVTVGIWWIVFLLPLLFFVAESHAGDVVRGDNVRAAYARLRSTFRKIRQYRNVMLFLGSYWLYIGGVFTVIFMAVNFGQRLGFDDSDLVMALLIANLVGFPATLVYGAAAHRFGARAGLYVALLAYIGACLWALQMDNVREFYVMATMIGMVQGGAQGLSRSMYAALIPSEQAGEFFAFYSMTTKSAHVLGPAMVAIAAMLSDDPKWVLLILMPLFVVGALLLARVRVPKL